MRNFIPGNSYNIVYLNLSRYLSFREITVISIENNILKAFDSISNEIRLFNLKRLKIINSIESKTIDEEI